MLKGTVALLHSLVVALTAADQNETKVLVETLASDFWLRAPVFSDFFKVV